MNPFFDQVVADSTDPNGTPVDTVKLVELVIKHCVDAVQERKVSYGRAITDRYWLEHCLRKRFGFPVDPQEPNGQ